MLRGRHSHPGGGQHGCTLGINGWHSNNLREVIAVARARPNEITFASSGNGTIGHLSLEMLKTDARISMLHIPYNGGARALTALLSGEVVIFASSLPPAAPHIKAGR
jgi:tripartite-type tricarboxylate transporter receptor subunit TctC